MSKSSFTFVIILCISLLSCKKQNPQLPSNKVVIDNSTSEALLAINQNLAIKEDSLLEIYVKKVNRTFIKNELGFWYKIEQAGNGKKLRDKSSCNFSYKLLSINGKFIKQGNEKIVLGKKQIVDGLEEGIKLIHYGDSATFIIPWYLGYGMKGDEPRVPPYTSIMYQIRVNK
jgi:FKBP-type peptidyl-prolyl cis-trans isomerase